MQSLFPRGSQPAGVGGADRPTDDYKGEEKGTGWGDQRQL